MNIEPNSKITDLLFLHEFEAKAARPGNVSEIKSALAEARKDGLSVRALGSNYSLSDVAVTDKGMVLYTDALKRILGISSPLVGRGVSLTYALSGLPKDRHFVMVEAGIKIRHLLPALAGFGLTLPTMGSGGGQSLVGALATASHGADFNEHLLADRIWAFHLIDGDGEGHWITRNDTEDRRVRLPRPMGSAAPLDATPFHDDAMFNACLCSVGRLGVIHSILIEVEKRYVLIETSTEHRTADVLEMFPQDQESYRGSQITQAEFGEFRKQHATIGKQFEALAPALRAHIEKINELPLHYVNVVINLGSPEDCWVRRRWKLPWDEAPIASPAPQPLSAFDEHLIKTKADFKSFLDGLFDALKLEGLFLGGIKFFAARWWRRRVSGEGLMFIPGPIAANLARRADIAIQTAIIAAGGTHIGGEYTPLLKEAGVRPILDLLVEVKNERKRRVGDAAIVAVQRFFDRHRKASLSPDRARSLFRAVAKLAIRELEFSTTFRADMADRVLDSHNYNFDGVVRALSAEFFFNARQDGYLEFIKELVANAEDQFYPTLGYIGIRFMPKGLGTLAMQRFAETVSVEITVFPGDEGEVPGARNWKPGGTGKAQGQLLFEYALELARQHGAPDAVPHWGQLFTHSREELAELYEEALLEWRKQLPRLGGTDMFSTEFSEKCGLEPLVSTE